MTKLQDFFVVVFVFGSVIVFKNKNLSYDQQIIVNMVQKNER